MPAAFVVDNSIVMAWCLDDRVGAYPDNVLRSLEATEACAPGIWPLELGNALVVATRRKLLTEASAAAFLAMVKELPIVVVQETPDRILGEIFSLAREYGLTTYDASYLDLAMRAGLPMATEDAALARAARKCRVAVYKP